MDKNKQFWKLMDRIRMLDILNDDLIVKFCLEDDKEIRNKYQKYSLKAQKQKSKLILQLENLCCKT